MEPDPQGGSQKPVHFICFWHINLGEEFLVVDTVLFPPPRLFNITCVQEPDPLRPHLELGLLQAAKVPASCRLAAAKKNSSVCRPFGLIRACCTHLEKMRALAESGRGLGRPNLSSISPGSPSANAAISARGSTLNKCIWLIEKCFVNGVPVLGGARYSGASSYYYWFDLYHKGAGGIT